MHTNARRMKVVQVNLSIRTLGFKSKESIQTEGLIKIIEKIIKEIYLISK